MTDNVIMNKWTPSSRKVGEVQIIRVSKHQIEPDCGERAAGWRGTGMPNLSRETKFSGANGDRKKFIFPVQLTTSRIGNQTRAGSSIQTCDIHVLLYVLRGMDP